MKQRFIDDLQNVANTITSECRRLAELNQLREKTHGGETLKLTLKAGETELSETLLNANGKALALDELFNGLENTIKARLYVVSGALETILETESAE